jgi:hypothetical protein
MYVAQKREALIKKYKNSTAVVGGTPEEIYDIMNASFRNMFKSMYYGLLDGQACEWCYTTKSLNRCHAGKSRPAIALRAIQDSPMNELGFRSHADIMIRFVSLHENEPVKILCQKCHWKFDHLKT